MDRHGQVVGKVCENDEVWNMLNKAEDAQKLRCAQASWSEGVFLPPRLGWCQRPPHLDAISDLLPDNGVGGVRSVRHVDDVVRLSVPGADPGDVLVLNCVDRCLGA
jgi:hypothetical protein